MTTMRRSRRAPRARHSSRLAAAPGALYQAVKEHVRARIRSGEWKAGDRVSSEHELVAALRVSRMTVNRALRELAEQGEVVRVAGVGTFVGDGKPQSGLLRVADIATEIRARGDQYSCDMVLASRERASAEVAAALGLDAGAPVYHSLCVHRENGVPIQIEDRYVNPKAAPHFIEQDFSRTRPAEYLLDAVPLDELEHVVDAVLPTRDEAARLEIRTSEPCLVLTRRTWSGPDVVTFVRCVHPGRRYRLGTRFRTRGSQPATA
jgi:GntR family histidine utilization transcriptional repressor